ncbi:hypothetical protein AC1031_011592 [Aphanomyces cochlioides]|nr:hypothetical protein AC1031_011592 [Aphanomyces cochlioides]
MTIFLVPGILRRICEYQQGIYQVLLPIQRFFSSVRGLPIHPAKSLAIISRAEQFEAVLSPWLADSPIFSRFVNNVKGVRSMLACHCAFAGHLNVLEFLEARYGLHNVASNLCELAAAGQRLHVLEFLQHIGYESQLPMEVQTISWTDKSVFHFSLAHYPAMCTTSGTIEHFASIGDGESLERLLPLLNEELSRETWNYAASYGHLELAQWFYAIYMDQHGQTFEAPPAVFSSTTYKHINNAGSRGFYDAMLWLYDTWSRLSSPKRGFNVAALCMKYAVAGSLWDRVWTLEIDARSESDVENANNVFGCLPHVNWPQDEHNIRKLFGLVKRASFFNHNLNLWSILGSSQRFVQILCTAWLSTIEDAKYRRSAEAILLTALVFSDALALYNRHKEVDTVALDMVLWLVEEYGVDENDVQELFQGPDCAVALQCAMENDRIPIMAFLHRCGTSIRPKDVFQYGGVVAMEYFMDKVDPEFVVIDEILIAMSSKPTKEAVLQYVHKLWSASTPRDLHKVESRCLHAAALNGQGRIAQYFAKSYEQTHSASEFESFLIQHVDAFYAALSNARYGSNTLFVMWSPVLDACVDVEFVIESLALIFALTEKHLARLVHLPSVHVPLEVVIECALVRPFKILHWRAFCILYDAKMKDIATRTQIQHACIAHIIQHQAYDVMSRFLDDMEFDLTNNLDLFVLFDVKWQSYLMHLLHQPNVRIKKEIVQWLEEFSPDEYQVDFIDGLLQVLQSSLTT